MTDRFLLLGLVCAALPGCGGAFCDEYPEACGDPVAGHPPAGAGDTGGGQPGGGAGGGEPTCGEPCVANDAATTVECVDGRCEYTCALGFVSCDQDPSTCETKSDDDGNCGGCGVDCAYDECTLIDESYACNDPIDIDAGDSHTCAIKRDGSIWCWGLNNYGQLGRPTPGSFATTPAAIASLPGTFRAAQQSQGRNYGCARSDDGAFACWPTIPTTNAMAQVMTGPDVDTITSFELSERDLEVIAITDPGQSLRKFIYNFSTTALVLEPLTSGSGQVGATSGYHRCVIFSGGALKCWGADDLGQVGNGGATSTTVSIPFEVMSGTEFIAVGTGEKHTCALALNGTIYCMGRNGSGYIAGTETAVESPVPFIAQPPFSALFVGTRTNAAVSNDQLYLFGDNDANQVKPSSGDATGPTLYALSAGDVPVDVALGMSHTCVLLKSGFVKCWGANATGQLGTGGVTPSSSPVTTLL
jgi:hypothetical protein